MENLLDQVLDRKNMVCAWDEVAENHGMPGVDNISVARWRRNWEERLELLRLSVHTHRYHPAKLRIRRIPKRTLGQWRVLRIPTVSDRVLQRAVLQILQPIFEDRFLDCSYGYRPNRCQRDAIQRIIDLREQGFCCVLDADIHSFFDSVNHSLLLRGIEDEIKDTELLMLIVNWLEIGAVQPGLGIPMGSPISPLLANIYLHPLDTALTNLGYHLVRYADDFVVLGNSDDDVQRIYHDVEEFLSSLQLRYRFDKTRITSFEEGFVFLGVHFVKDSYSFTFKNKKIESDEPFVDWLFSSYFPDYD